MRPYAIGRFSKREVIIAFGRAIVKRKGEFSCKLTYPSKERRNEGREGHAAFWHGPRAYRASVDDAGAAHTSLCGLWAVSADVVDAAGAQVGRGAAEGTDAALVMIGVIGDRIRRGHGIRTATNGIHMALFSSKARGPRRV